MGDGHIGKLEHVDVLWARFIQSFDLFFTLILLVIHCNIFVDVRKWFLQLTRTPFVDAFTTRVLIQCLHGDNIGDDRW